MKPGEAHAVLECLRSVVVHGQQFKNASLEKAHEANGYVCTFNQAPFIDRWSELGCRLHEAIELLEREAHK